MAKRVISTLLLVAAVCGVIAVPAFALSSNGNEGYVYSAFTFDRIEHPNLGSVAPIPWLDASADGRAADMTASAIGGVAFLEAQTLYSDGQIASTITLYGTNSNARRFTITAEQMILDEAEDFLVFGFNQLGGTVTVTGNSMSIIDDNGIYKVLSTPFIVNIPVVSQFVDVTAYLYDVVPDEQLMWLADVSLSYDAPASSGTVSSYSFVVVSNARQTLNHVDEIISGMRLSTTNGPTVDVGSFLVNSIGAFLDFQLIPGLSISGILGIVVTIALVFWFITLLV